MRILSLWLISLLHIVVFAEFNALCTTDADCNTDAGESCIRIDGQQGTYHCLSFPLPEAEKNKLLNGSLVGNQRKCINPEPQGCKGSRSWVESPMECCNQQMQCRPGSKIVRAGCYCTQGYECDNSAGCRANIDCPGSQVCIDQKCGYAKPGVDCGEDGKPPLRYRCCGSGVVGQDGMCYAAKGGCSGDSDCMVIQDGKAGLCCNGHCILRGDQC